MATSNIQCTPCDGCRKKTDAAFCQWFRDFQHLSIEAYFAAYLLNDPYAKYELVYEPCNEGGKLPARFICTRCNIMNHA